MIIILLRLLRKQIDSKYLPFFEVLASGIDEFLPYPFNEEIKGIAEALDVSLGDVVLINLIYDLTAWVEIFIKEQKLKHKSAISLGF